MAYIIETSKRDVSRYAEVCPYADGSDHECDGECLSLDGDVREIHDYGTSMDEYDSDDAEEHGSPVAWAVWHLTGSAFPDLHNGGSCHDGRRSEREWLSGSEPDPYRDQEMEYHVYLTGDWTPEERFAVFAAAGS